MGPPGQSTTAPDSQLRGFGPLGIAAMVVILAGNLLFAPLSALLVLAWRYLSGTPWHDIGYVRPRRWPRTIVIAVVAGALFKLVMKALVMPLLGAPAINPTYHYLAGNTAALPGMILAVLVVAGWGEETVFRGFLFERLRKLLGQSLVALAAIVVSTALLFGLAHYPDQKLAGVEQATITGLVFGAIYARTGELPPLMIAHAAFDLMAVALIYWNLEYMVAHILFR